MRTTQASLQSIEASINVNESRINNNALSQVPVGYQNLQQRRRTTSGAVEAIYTLESTLESRQINFNESIGKRLFGNFGIKLLNYYRRNILLSSIFTFLYILAVSLFFLAFLQIIPSWVIFIFILPAYGIAFFSILSMNVDVFLLLIRRFDTIFSFGHFLTFTISMSILFNDLRMVGMISILMYTIPSIFYDALPPKSRARISIYGLSMNILYFFAFLFALYFNLFNLQPVVFEFGAITITIMSLAVTSILNICFYCTRYIWSSIQHPSHFTVIKSPLIITKRSQEFLTFENTSSMMMMSEDEVNPIPLPPNVTLPSSVITPNNENITINALLNPLEMTSTHGNNITSTTSTNINSSARANYNRRRSTMTTSNGNASYVIESVHKQTILTFHTTVATILGNYGINLLNLYRKSPFLQVIFGILYLIGTILIPLHWIHLTPEWTIWLALLFVLPASFFVSLSMNYHLIIMLTRNFNTWLFSIYIIILFSGLTVLFQDSRIVGIVGITYSYLLCGTLMDALPPRFRVKACLYSNTIALFFLGFLQIALYLNLFQVDPIFFSIGRMTFTVKGLCTSNMTNLAVYHLRFINSSIRHPDRLTLINSQVEVNKFNETIRVTSVSTSVSVGDGANTTSVGVIQFEQ